MTIKRRIRIALVLMILIPVFLSVVSFSLARHLMEMDFHAGRFVPPKPGPGGALSFLAFLGVLVLINGLLSWWVSRGVLVPLAKLKDAADRLGEGDLSTGLDTTSHAAEFNDLARSFETMRIRLKGSLESQLAEEAARRELIAHVSHDLRTPVSVIRGYAEGLRDGVASDPERRERYVATILDRALQLEYLIDRLFAYATLGLDEAKPRLRLFDLAAFLGSVLPELDSIEVSGPSFPAGSKRKLTNRLVADSVPAGIFTVRADPAWLRRIAENLASNTLRHGAKDELVLEWSLAVNNKGNDSNSGENGKEIILRASDNGVGVDLGPETGGKSASLDKLFDPFFRADPARSGKGSGLGLAVVRKLAEAQGLRVWAEKSNLGGLAVVLAFPRVEFAGQPDAAKSTSAKDGP